MPKIDRNNPTRAKSSDSEYSLMEFMKDYPNDATCLDYLWRTRCSPDGEHAHCPKCKAERRFVKYTTDQRRQSWTCTACGKHVHPTAGTIFHKSATSLQLWFYAMYLMTSTRCGISAKQMERELGVTYKTAWRICHLIRTQLMQPDDRPLEGQIEVDETYVGGSRRGKHGAKRGRPSVESHKVPVFGMVERGGNVVARIVPNAKGETLLPHIVEKIMPKSTIYSDEWVGYNGVGNQGYRHRRCHHSTRVYVSGDAHTNTIEGFWSLVKRGIGGVYHSVSAKHLQSYLSEYAWRYNRRHEGSQKFSALLERAALAS